MAEKFARLIAFSIAFILVGAILAHTFGGIQPYSPESGSENGSYVPASYSTRVVNVTPGDAYAVGLSKRFEVLGLSGSPFVLKQGGGVSFRNAVLKVLEKPADEVTPEQYFAAADLAGFLKLKKLNESAEYYIMNPAGSFVLKVEGAKPSNVSVTFPPSASVEVVKTGTGSFRVVFHGYQGQRRIELVAICNGRKFERTVSKDGWRWTAALDLHLPVSTGNCGAASSYSCRFYVEDTLTLRLDRVYVIHRSFEAGSMSFFYRPACRWEDCHEDCWCEGGGWSFTCHCKRVCEWECNPCHPVERFSWRSSEVPRWAKKPLEYRPIGAARDYLLKAYADAIALKLRPVAVKTVEELKKEGKYGAFFGKMSEGDAVRLLEYFYAAQIPLDMRIVKGDVSRLDALFTGKANRSVVAGMYVLFENVTFVNASEVDLPIISYFGKEGVKRTYVEYVLLGSGQTFSPDHLKTSCGDVAVAELAYYRQPALQNFRRVLKVPAVLEMRKGYDSCCGVVYAVKRESCRVFG